jgi:hypothetical protein
MFLFLLCVGLHIFPLFVSAILAMVLLTTTGLWSYTVSLNIFQPLHRWRNGP